MTDGRSAITAEIRVVIPGYGTLRLPLDCAKLEPVQGGVEAWDENQNSIESWGRTETETDGVPGTSTTPFERGFRAMVARQNRKQSTSPTDSAPQSVSAHPTQSGTRP